MRFLAMALVLLACATSVSAKECSRLEAQEAEVIAPRLSDWNQIYDAFGRFRHCDDGAIAEGFTESVVRLLVSHWESLPKAAALAQRDASFRGFLLAHIDASADTNDLSRLAELAERRCPAEHRALCANIRAAAVQR